ncbi:MAG: pyrroline-5-carboxylate reductase [Deltaproteobacteria bacterium]|nr:pyrroline-5-carboxylate reductase [Deltaproteobacteria bacterium]
MSISGKIAFVGAGNMGEALIRGLLASKAIAPAEIRVSDSRKTRLDELQQRYGVTVCGSNIAAVEEAAAVVFCVKPQILQTVARETKEAIPAEAVVISVAAGKSSALLEACLAPGARVVRAMPNVAALVGEGATAVSAGAHATDDDVRTAVAMFEPVGRVLVVDESAMDAVTGLSGSGPAFIFMVIEALSDAGVKVGLSRWDSHALACQTVLGAAKLVIETQEHTGRLKDMVCSPGGTAIAAVHTLEQGGLRTTLINAVEVATRRARELGDRE